MKGAELPVRELLSQPDNDPAHKWAFLSQVLSVDSACRAAVRKVQAWWAWQGGGPISPNTSAYCQARARLRDETLEAIQQTLAQDLESNVSSDQLWLGRRV